MNFVSAMNEIRVRQIIGPAQMVAYSNIDKGIDGTAGRGEIVGASIERILPDGRRDCLTFMPATWNNIAQMLHRGHEVCVRVADMWKPIRKEEFLAMAYGYRADEELVARCGTFGQPEAPEAEVVIDSIGAFLALPQEKQLAALAQADFPLALADQIAESDHTSAEVYSVAMALLEKHDAPKVEGDQPAPKKGKGK